MLMKKVSIVFLLNIVFALLINCVAQTPLKPSPKDGHIQLEELIDSLTSSLSRYYIFPEKSEIISRYLKEQYRKGVYNKLQDPNRLASQLISDIQKTHYDSHFMIFHHDSDVEQKAQDSDDPEKLIKEGADFEKARNFRFNKLEIFPANIGYIQLNGFTNFVNEAKETLNSAMAFLKNSKALIIDLRYNGGGSPEMVLELESYFFKERVHTIDILSSFQKDTISLYTDPTHSNGIFLDMPIYILTSKNTFSGAEDFSYTMQALKRAKVVGDRTGGGAHLADQFPIGQGFVVKIPFARPISPVTLTNWEGVGVIPDAMVAAKEALTKAQEMIYSQFLSEAKTEKQKRRVQWALNDLKGRVQPQLLSDQELKRYTGTFLGGIHFFTKNGALLCKNPERGGDDTFKLTSVGKDLFLLDENAQIEFVKDSQNKYSSIRILWIDGNVTEKLLQKVKL